jgi:hypothetical protein
MAEMSNYLEDKILDHVLTNTSYTSPTTVYLGLFTSDPTDADVGTEVSGGSYARQVISFAAASSGTSASDQTIEFPQATASWGTISHVGILDALTTGNLLFHTPLTTSKSIDSGDIFRVSSGNLTVTID